MARKMASYSATISIHALREEGDFKVFPQQSCWYISIHALREEGDPVLRFRLCLWYKISIHALREEGDSGPTGFWSVCRKFLSTPSVRRATQKGNPVGINLADFYPRPP